MQARRVQAARRPDHRIHHDGIAVGRGCSGGRIRRLDLHIGRSLRQQEGDRRASPPVNAGVGGLAGVGVQPILDDVQSLTLAPDADGQAHDGNAAIGRLGGGIDGRGRWSDLRQAGQHEET